MEWLKRVQNKLVQKREPSPEASAVAHIVDISETVNLQGIPIVVKAGGCMDYTDTGFTQTMLEKGGNRTVIFGRGRKTEHRDLQFKMFDLLNLDVRMGDRTARPDEHAPSEGYTYIAAVPLTGLSSVKFSRIGIKDFSKEFNPSDVAIYVEFLGRSYATLAVRNAPFRAVAVTSASNATAFVERVQERPELAYELVRKIHGQRLRGGNTLADGSIAPMQVLPGKEVFVLPNAQWGGTLPQTRKSVPFSESFDPNPPDI